MTRRYPQSQAVWYNLALVQSARRNCDEATLTLKHALTLDGADHHVLNLLRIDHRLDNCRANPQFQQLLTQPPPAPTGLPDGVTITH